MDRTTLEHPFYNPDMLLDTVKVWCGLNNDAALARHLQVRPSTISKIRHRRCPISPELLLRMHDATAAPIRDLRFLGGDFRRHTGETADTIAPDRVPWELSEPVRRFAIAALEGRKP